jgi:hypothetical protein
VGSSWYAPACLCFVVVVQAASKLPSRRIRVFGWMFRVRWDRREVRVNSYEASAPTEVEVGVNVSGSGSVPER